MLGYKIEPYFGNYYAQTNNKNEEKNSIYKDNSSDYSDNNSNSSSYNKYSINKTYKNRK